MWDYVLSAIALLLVFEGLLPALSPHQWRGMMLKAAMLDDRVLRIIGLICMVVGAVLMYLVHSGLLFG